MIVLLWPTATTYGHAGEGDPIFARVEVPEKTVYSGDSVRVIFHVFDLKALEVNQNEETLAQAEVTVLIEKGDNRMTAIAEKENGQYVADLKFPEAGKWKLTAHVERPDSDDHHSEQDEEQNVEAETDIEPHDSEDTTYFETTIKVKYSFEKIAPLWVWPIGLVLLVIGFFFARKIRKR